MLHFVSLHISENKAVCLSVSDYVLDCYNNYNNITSYLTLLICGFKVTLLSRIKCKICVSPAVEMRNVYGAWS